jgi:hypothetical protein
MYANISGRSSGRISGSIIITSISSSISMTIISSSIIMILSSITIIKTILY